MGRRLVDVLIAVWFVAVVVFWTTGGWEFSFAGVEITSHRLSSLLNVLALLVAIRIAISLGVANTATLAVSIGIALALAELFVRWFAPMPGTHRLLEVHRPSDLYGWELNPGISGYGYLGERIDINSVGLRDGEHPFEHPRTFRVACVGDSFTFGMGVNLEDSYTKRFEAALREREPSVEVLNFGVIAYQLWQIVRVIENRVPAYRPDLVLIGFFYDDVLIPMPPDGDIARNPFETITPREYTSLHLLNLARNALRSVESRYRYVGGARYLASIDERRAEIASGGEFDRYYRAQAGLLDETTVAQARADLERIAAWSRQHTIPVLAALIPDSTQLHDPDRQAINRWFAAELARLGIPFHDLAPALEADPDPRSLYLLPQDAHTSPKANRLIGQALATDATVLALLQKLGGQSPSTRSASPSPGQAGIVTATMTSASPPART